jgi:ectoine hydroxylase-related dioxygenase (phytanoyl-CoA dioxygenase family)
MSPSRSTVQALGWVDADDCRLEDFRAVVERVADPADHRYADSIEQSVPIYGGAVREQLESAAGRRDVQAELVRVLLEGPGLLVFKGAFEVSLVDRATEVFEAMIVEQKTSGTVAGDHFATPGANDRVWGALDKLASRAPHVFVDYYGNDILGLICEAWLGPGYQMTSQVNVVNPGGRAQVAHADYHLGFMSVEEAQAYPLHVHAMSPALTLQGAVAHCAMPIETGPTMYLPYSQNYRCGYVACHKSEFVDYFAEHYVQLPLDKGDAAFFNPALFHGAGTNRSSDVRRMANLLQVSSPFGRAMESVDRVAISKALYPLLRERKASGASDAFLGNVIAASAEGYAFPTNLDRDQPVGGLAPESQADLVWRALEEDWDGDAFDKELDAHSERHRPYGSPPWPPVSACTDLGRLAR